MARSGDIVVVYHTLKVQFDGELGTGFKIYVAGKRHHPLKMYKPKRDNLRVYLRPSVRMVNEANCLSSIVGMSPSVKVFKMHFDRDYVDVFNKKPAGELHRYIY